MFLASEEGQILISNNYEDPTKYVAVIQNIFFRIKDVDKTVIGFGVTPNDAVQDILDHITGLEFKKLGDDDYQKVPILTI